MGFPLDDSWIYAVFARNFTSSGEIAFNLGHPSVGFTSSLWFLFISLGNILHLPVISWSLFLGCISQLILAMVIGALVYQFLVNIEARTIKGGFDSGSGVRQKDLRNCQLRTRHMKFMGISLDPARIISFLASLMILICGPLIWYSLSGMETSCFMTVGMLAIFFLSRNRYWWSGLTLGLLLITRIEGIALWGIALIYAVILEGIKAKKGFVKKLFPLFIIPSGFLLMELIKNLSLTGALLPTTFAGRKWLSVPAGGRGPVAYLKLWGYGFKLTLLPHFIQKNPFLILFWIGAGIFTCISIRLLVKDVRKNLVRISGLSLLCLWIIGHNMVYIVMLPSPSQAGRYQALNYLIFWLLLFLPLAAGFVRLMAYPGGKRKVFCGAFLVILLIGIFLLDLTSTARWKKIYYSTVSHINDVHIQISKRIKNDLPPRSRVAAFDIGALKYFSPGTEIIDLGGLVDREFSDYLKEGKVVDYMKKRDAGYLAMVELQNSPGWIFENLHIMDDSRLILQPIFGLMQRPDIYRTHYREAAITFPKMVLYKIKWTERGDFSQEL